MTSSLQKWPVRFTTLGDASCGTRLWSSRGHLRVTVVVKGTFAIVHGGVMTPVAATAIVRDDEHEGDEPARSLRAAGELAPHLLRVDVPLTGHAHAPPGRSATSVTARLTLLRGSEALIDKSIVVHGDRAEETGEPLPFQQMPLVYERALGGPASADNPAGVGLAPGRLPNLLDPEGRPVPACFAPIPGCWPARTRLLRDIDVAGLSALVPAIEAELDWAYFQAAPSDQRVDELRGDETIVLESLHADLPRVESRLPSARAVARLHGPFGDLAAGKPIELRADTVHIDAAEQRCTILWRGHFPATGLDLRDLELVAGIELPGRPVAWPEVARGRPAFSTVRMSASDLAKQIEAAGYGMLAPEGSPPASPRAVQPSRADMESTLAITPDVLGSAPADPLPFRSKPEPGRDEVVGRVTLDLREAAAQIRPESVLPFRPGEGQIHETAGRREPAPRQEETAGRATVHLRAEDTARLTARDTLPFQREPDPATNATPARATLHLRAEDIARLTARDALPFQRDPEGSSVMPPVAAPPPPLEPVAAMAAPPPPPEPATAMDAPPPPPVLAEPPAPPPMIGPLATPEMYASGGPPVAPPVEPAREAPEPAVAAPPPPAPELHERYPLEQCAAIAASIARTKSEKARILQEHELEPKAWVALEKYWNDTVRAQATSGKTAPLSGKTALLKAYDEAYVAQLEKERGPIEVEEYARLMVAREAGAAPEELAALDLPRDALIRIQRVWLGRIAADAELGKRVRAAMENVRKK